MNNTKNRLIQQLLLNKKASKKQNGFTLIELMVVIAIVGILSAVGLPEMLKAQDRAKDSVAKQEAIAAAKECSIYLLTGEVGDEPDGSDFTDVDVTTGCEEVVSTSEGDGNPTFTITLEGSIPGPIVDSRS